MMQSLRPLFRQNLKSWRHFSRSATLKQEAAAVAAATAPPPPLKEPLTVPQPSADKTYSPKIEKLVTEISNLNLIEVSELSTLLKTRLNLPDAPAFVAGAVGPAAAAEDEEDAAAPKIVQTSFTVKLTKFDEKQKVPLIKEIKNLIEGMNLVQAKKFVESAPAVVKADVAKDEAEKLKEALVKVGAEVEIV